MSTIFYAARIAQLAPPKPVRSKLIKPCYSAKDLRRLRGFESVGRLRLSRPRRIRQSFPAEHAPKRNEMRSQRKGERARGVYIKRGATIGRADEQSGRHNLSRATTASPGRRGPAEKAACDNTRIRVAVIKRRRGAPRANANVRMR